MSDENPTTLINAAEADSTVAGAPEPEESFGSILTKLGPAGLLGVLWLAAPPLAGFGLLAYADTVSQWLKSHPVGGVWMYIGAFVVTAGLGLMPTYAQSVLGGFAFGAAMGIPAALMGFAGGSIIGYEVARRASGERVMRILKDHPRYAAARDALVGGGFWKTLGIVTLLRLPPNSPFAITNLALASVKVSRPAFLLGTVFGMAPRTAFAVMIGASISSFTKESLASSKWMMVAGVVMMLVVLVILGKIANKAMERVTGGTGGTGAQGTK